MNLAELSIKRPIFITCVVILMLAVGALSASRLGVDLFPNVTFPVVTVTTPYPGAGPSEVETLISKPMEDELSTISGIKRLSSTSAEGRSTVVAEFTLETDVKFAENQIRDRVAAVKRKLPTDSKEPNIRRIDPADQPVLVFALDGKLKPGELYDIANEIIRPKIEQINQVGLVEVIGGRKREIQVQLDRAKIKNRDISASMVVNRLGTTGEDIPLGTIDESSKQTVFRTLGQFKTLEDINQTIVNFYGNEVPVRIKDVGTVIDTLVDETARTYVNGQRSLFIFVFRQSGSNTVAVADAVKNKIIQINTDLAKMDGVPSIKLVRDSSVWIRANITDVKESISFGIILAVLVVFFFLGSLRSTIITGLALPNSLIGAFILMAAAGFTINIMTLLALSLTVGLLIDDAIVVRENIFRHIEQYGKSPLKASIEGTNEVRLAVIATTLCVIAVFGPLGFLKGVTGQFFKEFGLTVCFALLISLFDALTIAPMLSAYFAGISETNENSTWERTIGKALKAFDRFQTNLENAYEKSLKYTVKYPIRVVITSTLLFLGSCVTTIKGVPKTFLPPQDAGEFSVAYDLPPGTNLDAMTELSMKIDTIIRSNKEVELSALTVGSRSGDPNYADAFVRLVPAKERKLNTSQMKDKLREQLKEFKYANVKVKDYDAVAAGMRPFNLNILGTDLKELEAFGNKVFEKVKNHPGLKDVDVNYRAGKPEFQIKPDPTIATRYGISSLILGNELRTQVQGSVGAVYREKGREYDIRVRLKDDQRNLKESYENTYVPNINNSLVKLSDVAKSTETVGPSQINRQERGRYIQINADMAPNAGMGQVMSDIDKMLADGELKLPHGMRYAFVGQAENFKELGESMVIAIGLGMLFIYLVLSSLYESFAVPFTIMIAIPLAFVGSGIALFISQQSINIFSMIGIVMLFGVATKNSILLVDYANQKVAEGIDRSTALIMAGKTRLRPILMTTMALIAGSIPIALGLNEASRQRTSMGVAIIGGLISSTLLTLFVVPATYSYVDRFRHWAGAKLGAIFLSKHKENQSHGSSAKEHSQNL